MTYTIASQFSKTPGGRFRKNGPYSGEEFRDDVLRDLLGTAIRNGEQLTIVLDGTAGYPSSFLEEAFGGLIRLRLFSSDEVRQHLRLRADDPTYKSYLIDAKKYMEQAQPQS